MKSLFDVFKTEAKVDQPVTDTDLDLHRQNKAADEKLFAECFSICEQTFEKAYGQKPDYESDLWKWYITEAYQTTLRLMVTKQKGGRS